MNSHNRVILSPRQLELYQTLTVRSDNAPFFEINYMITDESGKLIRKGAISNGINEFKLCIVGFKTGVYKISIGQTMEHFTVI
ncbi:hypothetical protein BH11BAC4_BH11BAC4_22130 [soil metagenome]